MSQHMEALALANEVRIEAARQRRELRHAPARVLVEAIVNPTPELATYRLRSLFSPAGGGGIVLWLGPHRLSQVLNILTAESGVRRWHPEIRLGELTEQERRRLVRRLIVSHTGHRRAA